MSEARAPLAAQATAQSNGKTLASHTPVIRFFPLRAMSLAA